MAQDNREVTLQLQLQQDKTRIEGYFSKIEDSMSRFDYPGVNGNLNSIEVKLRMSCSLEHVFKEKLGHMHYLTAKQWSSDEKKMKAHLNKAYEFGSTLAEQAIQVLSGGNNPFLDQARTVPTHDLRGQQY